ncbi:NAA40 acetyltransferase, partial [Indicator maculatus]|nr:NAA40 acetyltransferase [Indicator maculatus]
RKSSKAKEKKQKRLEERAAMDAVCAKVEAANKVSSSIWAFFFFPPPHITEVLGFSPPQLLVGALTPGCLSPRYEQSEWGWKEREKRQELRDDRAWYLLAREPGTGPVAFSHFRFDVECGDEVLYWWVPGKGVLCWWVPGEGVLYWWVPGEGSCTGGYPGRGSCTGGYPRRGPVLVGTRGGVLFEVDAASPSVSGCCGDDASYEILSRRTKFGESHPHAGGGHCGGCCH